MCAVVSECVFADWTYKEKSYILIECLIRRIRKRRGEVLPQWLENVVCVGEDGQRGRFVELFNKYEAIVW
jgi:hypothetical protein